MTSHLSFQPPFDWPFVVAGAGAVVAVWIVLRLVVGKPAGPARRTGLLVLRAATLLVLLAILAGPVRVDSSAGAVRRPDVFVLLDGSQSMTIGSPASRWDEAVAALSTAASTLEPTVVDNSLHVFRFGHRLSAVDDAGNAIARSASKGLPPGDTRQLADRLRQGGPTDSDTRLAEALRQLSGRFGQRPPGAVVLVSDGRARDAAAVEEMAVHYGERGIPLSVYPVGSLARGGDVALVAVVAPQRVRKFSDVEVQVFLRSFGYSGRRTEVQVVGLDDESRPQDVLASLPVTLRGGAQSVTLSYRSDTRGRTIAVHVPAQDDELSPRNNQLTAHVDIDRTKIRVLYIEGGEGPLRVVTRGGRRELDGPFGELREMLTEDEDIECVVLSELPGAGELYRVSSYGQATGRQGFPETQAELSAFDCVILSDVAATSFTEEQLDWLARWVENRGGGLVMTGGAESFLDGGWGGTPLAELLPVSFADSQWLPSGEGEIAPTDEAAGHSIWQIVSDREQNRAILDAVPPVEGLHQGLEPKPLTEVLAVAGADASEPAPVLVAGRYGRGRTMSLAVPLTAPAAEKFLHEWGPSGNRHAGKFWRNVVYWLTEGSSIGRRRLIAAADKRFYRPGETIALSAVAYDETATRTTSYSVWAMIEPKSLDFDDDSLTAPVRWPNALPRESGEDGPRIVWGEEFPLPRTADGRYELPLELAERLSGGAGDEGLRIELTAYEGGGDGTGFSRGTQVDSTSLDIQILSDPFEQQNPFPNHDLLRRVAGVSGGRVLQSPDELAAVIADLPVAVGPPVISTVPVWNRWWLWGVLIGLLTIEWVWRRGVGLA
ncbi:MAG: glutamine amidotransferase [Planctomycetes bacterium]|nr:glutamine amidotransferase [Planctomycetota bacterium]